MSSMLAAVRAAALGSTALAGAPAGATQQEEDQMTTATTAGTAAPAPPPAVRTYTQAELEAALASARAEARTAGLAEGATAERGRILGIEALAMPGHEKLIADLKADGTTAPDQAAARIIAAEKAKGNQRLDAIRGVETETGKVAAAPLPTTGKPAAPGAEKDVRAAAAADAGKAREYIAAQAKLGITVSAAEAVAHVSKEG